MKKIQIYFVVFVLCFMTQIFGVQASDDGVFAVTDEATLDQCLKSEQACRLMANLTIKNSKDIASDLVLDLNGYNLLADPTFQLKSGLISVLHGGKLTINDSKGNGKISTGPDGNVWAAIMMLRSNQGTLPAELVVNGGTIEGYYYGITGNGNNHNTKITINDGVIKGLNQEDSAGIYQPQQGDVIINGGTIIGGTGIEIRSGNLAIQKGTIEATATKFIKMVNGNGTTTNGVGVGVAQHTTKNSIQVVISGGNISGQYAVYEWNPHNNDQEAIQRVHLSITGGEFTGLATGVKAVYSQDVTEFISGGKFNTDVTEYLSPNAQVTLKTTNSELDVFHESKEKKTNLLGWFLFFLFIVGSILSYVYCKKNKILFK